jgi:hypothetical protein
MKKVILGILLSCILIIAKAQEQLVVDYAKIKEAVTNQESEYYYPKLLKRYNDFDNSLTLQEYAFIYYGFAFQEGYLKSEPSESKLIKLKQQNDFEGIIKECRKILAKNPVSLEAINSMGYALYKLGKAESEWKKYQHKYGTLRKVIVYSGDGLSVESAFKVIYVSDEYNIIQDYFEIPKILKQSLVGACDRFEVEPSDYFKNREVYFDISIKLNKQQSILIGKGKK